MKNSILSMLLLFSATASANPALVGSWCISSVNSTEVLNIQNNFEFESYTVGKGATEVQGYVKGMMDLGASNMSMVFETHEVPFEYNLDNTTLRLDTEDSRKSFKSCKIKYFSVN